MLELADLLPEKFVLKLASAYIAGRDEQDSISIAHDIYKRYKFTGVFDLLGEAASSAEQCQIYVDKHLKVIDLIKNKPLPVPEKQKQLTMCFKTSMFCASPIPGAMPSQSNLDDGFARIAQVVEYAYKNNVLISIDAEDHRWTDFQNETYFALLDKGYSNLGAVLQTRLFRTKRDLQRFDERGRVRLCIGIYQESSEIAYTNKKQMKELLIEYSRQLLAKGVYLEFATHDQHYVNKFFTDIILPQQITPDKFETQFLFGVPRLALEKMLVSGEYFKQWQSADNNMVDQSHLARLIQFGVPVRLYMPFGADVSAAPYCKRRLRENPNLFIYGIKNLLQLQ